MLSSVRIMLFFNSKLDLVKALDVDIFSSYVESYFAFVPTYTFFELS